MRNRFALAIGAGVLACTAATIASVQAQQFVLSSQDRAKLIAVDFSAVSADGLPVRDLRPDEVTLKIDGRTRAIRSLEYVPVRATAGVNTLLPFGSNVGTEGGRAIVLIVDFESIRPGREAALREHIGHFVLTLSPNDRVALVTVPYGGALPRVLRETGGDYLARFEPQPEETQGSVRGLSVDISRPGVELRTRPQMTVMRQQSRVAGAAPATPLAMMKEARVFRNLPLRVVGFSSREPGARDVRVIVLFDSPDPAAALNDAIVGLFSEDGRLVSSRVMPAAEHLEVYGGREGARVGVMFEITRTLNGPAIVTMPGAFAATNEADRFLVTAAIPIGALAPGDYVVRATVAAQDQAGGRVVRLIRKVAR